MNSTWTEAGIKSHWVGVLEPSVSTGLLERPLGSEGLIKSG